MGGLPAGLTAPWASYHARSICAGFAKIFANAVELDVSLGETAKLSGLRLLPCCCLWCTHAAERSERVQSAPPEVDEYFDERAPASSNFLFRENSTLGHIFGSVSVEGV